MAFTLSLPMPPSANKLTRNVTGKGRVKTDAYHKWVLQADKHFLYQKRGLVTVKGRFAVNMLVPHNSLLDIDNSYKICGDWMVSRQLTPDDRMLQDLRIRRADLPGDMIEITVSEA